MPTRSTLLRRALILRSDDLGRKVLSGASFQFLGIVLRTAITIGSTAILARLLSPADFGYVAMATVVTEFAALFSNFGFNALLIQRRVINRLQVDTVFWASLMLGVLLGTAVFVASFFSSWLFDDPRVGDLLRVLCLSFVLGGLITIPDVVLHRLMRFRTEFWIQLTAIATRTSVAVAFAYAGFGVWSLVAGALTGVLMQVVLGFLAVPYLPRLRFYAPVLTSSWRTSGSYFGGGLLFYAGYNIDLILIGRYLGAAQLGYYQNARALTDEIRARIAVPLQRVLFPAFSAVQTERERLQQMVIRSGRLIAAIVAPAGVGVAATAPELVRVLYGDQWLAMVPLMSLFGLSAGLKASTAISIAILNACDRVSAAFKHSFYGTVAVAIGIWFALPYGVVAVSATVAIMTLYTLVPFRVALGLIGLDMRHLWQILGPPALSCAALWTVIEVIRPVSAAWTSNQGALLLLHTALGAITYLVVLHSLSRQYLQDFRQLAGRLLSRG